MPSRPPPGGRLVLDPPVWIWAVEGAAGRLAPPARESARKSAGLRTHMLVGIAAALYTALAELAVADVSPRGTGFQADPIRAIQAVAIGIGFLGSGVIFVSRHEDRVQGLTTAASIWATAAIGIAAGRACKAAYDQNLYQVSPDRKRSIQANNRSRAIENANGCSYTCSPTPAKSATRTIRWFLSSIT